MEILLEDKDLIAVYKRAGEPTQTKRLGEQDIVSLVKNHIKEKEKKDNPYVAVINRLDQPVEGIVLLAKNKDAAAKLSAGLQNGDIKKYYYATVYGQMKEDKGTLTHFLKKDGKTNLSSVVSENDPEAKKAILHYEVVRDHAHSQLVRIELVTGRHHQIRVQFSTEGNPLLGDKKYGTAESIKLGKQEGFMNPALCAYQLMFTHPKSKKECVVEVNGEQMRNCLWIM